MATTWKCNDKILYLVLNLDMVPSLRIQLQEGLPTFDKVSG